MLFQVLTMQTIAIPTYLSHLPIYQGWPVPFTQAWFDGKPDFRTVDPQKTVRCVTEKLCATCGRRLGDKSYFIGGPLSKANRVFTDPPMHKRCAEFAAQTCPFVSGRKLEYSKRPVNANMAKIQEMVSTQRPTQMFILTAWTKKTRLVRHGDNIFIWAASWISRKTI